MVDFYPSITEELLMKSLNYVKLIEAIDKKVVKVIIHSRKSLLFDRDNVWVKKENVTFNLKNEKYPFRKPNNDPLYINAPLVFTD